MNCLRLFRNLQQKPFLKISTLQYVTQHPQKYTETQNRWRRKDGVSQKWELIYKAPMENILRYLSTYLTVSTTTFAGVGAYYCIFMFNWNDWSTPLVLGDDVVIANNGQEFLVYLGTFVILHIATKVLMSKYVVRLYQDGDRYLAVFRGHLHNSIRKHEFELKEFKKLNPTLVVSWGDARFSLGKKHGIILADYFKTPEHFNYLLTGKKAQEEGTE